MIEPRYGDGASCRYTRQGSAAASTARYVSISQLRRYQQCRKFFCTVTTCRRAGQAKHKKARPFPSATSSFRRPCVIVLSANSRFYVVLTCDLHAFYMLHKPSSRFTTYLLNDLYGYGNPTSCGMYLNSRSKS